MISKPKKYTIGLLELPLVILNIVLKSIVAVITLIFIRVVLRGIFLGKRLHINLEAHELGHKKENK